MTAVGSWRLAMFLKGCLFRICMSLVLINNSFLKYYQLFSTKIINLKMINLELFLTIICNVLYMREISKNIIIMNDCELLKNKENTINIIGNALGKLLRMS